MDNKQVQEIMALARKWHDDVLSPWEDSSWDAFESRLREVVAPPVPEPKQPELTVWYGSLPESNGKHNWSVILHRKGSGIWDGFQIERTEYPDRARYEADRLRHLIGELDKAPDILAYDGDLRSEATHTQPASEPVARVNNEGFIVEVGDLLLSPGMELFATPQPAAKPAQAAAKPAQAEPVARDLTRLAQLAEQHALSYASPHHFTLSVYGLRSIIEAAAPTQPRPQPLSEGKHAAYIQTDRNGERELVWERDEELDGVLYEYTPLATLQKPAEWQALVPVEPTEAMEKAFNAICTVGEDFGDAWSAACAAAPAQPRPQPLTDEQIMEIAKNPMTAPCSPWWLKDDVVLNDIRTAAKLFARAIEAAHGITAPEPTK